MNLSVIVILNMHGADYHCIISEISQCDIMKLKQTVHLIKKSETS